MDTKGYYNGARKHPGRISMAELWQQITYNNSNIAMVTWSICLVLVEIFVLSIHRSYWKSLIAKNKLQNSKDRYVTAQCYLVVPVVVSCFLVASVLLPNSAHIFLILGKLTYVIGSYLTVQFCLKQCGASVDLFTLSRLLFAHRRDKSEHRKLYNRLSLNLNLITQEIFLNALFSFLLLLLVYDKDDMYPKTVHSNIILAIYHIVLFLSWVLSCIGYYRIIFESKRQAKQSAIFWYPAGLKFVHGVSVILEVLLSITLSNHNDNKFTITLIRFLVINGTSMISANFIMLCVMTTSTKSDVRKIIRTHNWFSEKAILPLTKHKNNMRNSKENKLTKSHVIKASHIEILDEQLYITLGENDSRELLEYWKRDNQAERPERTVDLEDGIRLLAQNPRKMSNSISSIATY